MNLVVTLSLLLQGQACSKGVMPPWVSCQRGVLSIMRTNSFPCAGRCLRDEF